MSEMFKFHIFMKVSYPFEIFYHIQSVAKLHTQTSTDGRGDQNKDFLVI